MNKINDSMKLGSLLVGVALLCTSQPTHAADRGKKVSTLTRGEPTDDGFYVVPAASKTHPLRAAVTAWEPNLAMRRALYRDAVKLSTHGKWPPKDEPPAALPSVLLRADLYKGQFVVYQPCQGPTARLIIAGGFVEYYPRASDPVLLQIQPAGGSSVGNAFLLPVTLAGQAKALTLIFTRIDEEGHYSVSTPAPLPEAGTGRWVTPEALATMDVMINHCPSAAREEFPFP